MKDLAIVIVGHNSREFFAPCLQSTRAAIEGLEATVFVVDNGGNDGTADYVRAEFPWCDVICSRHNGGYSYGNNLGLRAAGFPNQPRFRHAMLLNPDTVIPPDAIRHMVTYLDAQPEIGVVGPKLVLENGALDRACKRGVPTPLTSLFYFAGLARLFPRSRLFGRYNMTFIDEDEIADVDSTVGACQLMRGDALRKVGLMDEAFFMYGEDLDLNLRIRAAGYRVVYYPKVTIKHLKGTSTRKEPERMIRAFYSAMKVFHRKHFAANHSAAFNWIVYQSIDLICAYQLLRNRLRPASQRVVGSAPGG